MVAFFNRLKAVQAF